MQTLINDFKKFGLNTPNLYERFIKLCADKNGAFEFAKILLTDRVKRFSALFKDSLSFLDEEHFKELISLSIEILKDDKDDENASEVITHASLEFVELLHPYLDEIFAIKVNEKSYYDMYPWRNLSFERSQIWRDMLVSSDTPKDDKERIFNALLQSRDEKNIIFAYDEAVRQNLFNRDDLKRYLGFYLAEVGFDLRQNGLEKYHANECYNIIFDETSFNPPSVPWLKKYHETWNLKPQEALYKFGGSLGGRDENPLFHLITINGVKNLLPSLKISLDNITLAAHINEIHFNTLFYKHDEKGVPMRIGDEGEVDFSDEPIKESFVRLAKTPKRYLRQDWAISNSRQNLFRLGGEPSWIQGSDVPVCPHCERRMKFLLQLDSDLVSKDGREILFGSGGICYAFWCDECRISGLFVQCT